MLLGRSWSQMVSAESMAAHAVVLSYRQPPDWCVEAWLRSRQFQPALRRSASPRRRCMSWAGRRRAGGRSPLHGHPHAAVACTFWRCCSMTPRQHRLQPGGGGARQRCLVPVHALQAMPGPVPTGPRSTWRGLRATRSACWPGFDRPLQPLAPGRPTAQCLCLCAASAASAASFDLPGPPRAFTGACTVMVSDLPPASVITNVSGTVSPAFSGAFRSSSMTW